MATAKHDTRFRQNQIVETILALVARRGVAALSTAAVAAELGLVPSALYRHFRNKDRMVDAAVGHVAARLLHTVQAVRTASHDPLDQLRLLLSGFAARIGEHMIIPQLLFAEEIVLGPRARTARLQRYLRAYLRGIEKIIDDGRRQHQVQSPLPTATLAIMFLGLFQSAGLVWRLSGGTFDVRAHVRRAWQGFAAVLANDVTNHSHTN